MKLVESVKTFISEIAVEMKKVTWSSRKELVNSAWVVVVSVLIFTVVLGFFDFIFSKLISFILKQGL